MRNKTGFNISNRYNQRNKKPCQNCVRITKNALIVH